MDSFAQLMDETLAVLERNGWCKHMLTDAEGRNCLGGALNLAATGQDQWRAGDLEGFYRQLAAAVLQLFPARVSFRRLLFPEAVGWPVVIAEFNNDPDTTFADIKAVMARAVELEAPPAPAVPAWRGMVGEVFPVSLDSAG